LTIFKFTLLKGLRNPLTLVANCFLPLALIFIRPLWANDATIGARLMVMVMWGGAFLMSQSVLKDKEDGSIIRILAAPVTMLGYLTQSLLAFTVPLLVQTALISAAGAVLYGWDAAFLFALALCYIAFTVSAVALGFAWSCLFKCRDNSSSIFITLITFGSFLSGIFLPLELLPRPLQYVGAIIPSYWAVRGISALPEYDTAYWSALLAMLLLAAIYLFYGGKRRLI